MRYIFILSMMLVASAASAHVYNPSDTSLGDEAHGWGDHSLAGYGAGSGDLKADGSVPWTGTDDHGDNSVTGVTSMTVGGTAAETRVDIAGYDAEDQATLGFWENYTASPRGYGYEFSYDEVNNLFTLSRFNGTTSGDIVMAWGRGTRALQMYDTSYLGFGTSRDSEIWYNGTHTFWNLRRVGSGNLTIQGGTLFMQDSGVGVNTSVEGASTTLTDLECYGNVIYVTGAYQIDLPAVVAGMSVTVISTTAAVVSVNPDGSEQFRLDGPTITAGNEVDSTGAAGDVAVFTYYGAGVWYVTSNTWVDGGAS